MPKYIAYQKKLTSDFKIPFLTESFFNSADITIVQDDFIEKICIDKQIDCKENNDVLLTEENTIILIRPNIGLFLIKNGNEIRYVNKSNLCIYEFSRFLLNTCMLFLLYQRDYLVLHASAISNNDDITIFIGNSGSGKSTIAYECSLNSHCRIVAEDVVAIKNTSPPLVISSFPLVKLAKNIRVKDGYKFVANSNNDRLSRKMVTIPNHKFFHGNENQDLKNVIFLQWADNNSIERLDNDVAFSSFFKNTLRHVPPSRTIAKEKIALECIGKIIRTANIYLFKRNQADLLKDPDLPSNFLKHII